MNKRIKGVWLFGSSGSGKTRISKLIKKYKKNSFVIDGDVVRKHVSFDLNYTLQDRIIQTKRLLGISKICIYQNYFPIISSVYLGKDIANFAKRINIRIIEVLRDKKFLNKKIKVRKNIVGIDIKQPKLSSYKIYNNKYLNKNFKLALK